MSGPTITPSTTGIAPEILAEHRRIHELTGHLERARDLRELLTHLAGLRPLLPAPRSTWPAAAGAATSARACARPTGGSTSSITGWRARSRSGSATGAARDPAAAPPLVTFRPDDAQEFIR